MDRLNNIFQEIADVKHQIRILQRKETSLSREIVNIILKEGGKEIENCSYGLEYTTPDKEFQCEIYIDVLKKNIQGNYSYAECRCDECREK